MNHKNITDMTTGSSVKHIFKFAMPLLIGNLFQQLYNMVDSIVVGKFVSANALAAVGACGSMNFLLFALSSGLAIGIGVIVSQYFGAKDDEHVRMTIANSVYVLISMAIVTSVVGYIFSPEILRILQTPETVIADSITYMRITCLGVVAIAIYNGIASILRALGDSKTPLYFLILSTVVNVILDLLFVICFDWRVFGVAVATVISQLVAAITCFIYAYKKIPFFHLNKQQLKPQKDIILNSFRLGVPVAFQNSLIAISCMVLQGVVNTYGESVMAAYTIVGRIEQIVQQPYSSLGMAITNYSGQNIGAGKPERVKKGYRDAVIMVFIFSVCLIPIAYVFGEQIIGLFVNDQEVISIGVKALRINSLFYFALGMIYVPRAVLNGCGDAGFAMFNGAIEVACRISYSQIFTRIPKLGYWGIWVTTGATWFTTAVVCVIRYMRGKWKNKGIIQNHPDS